MQKEIEKENATATDRRNTIRKDVIESICFSHFNEDGSLNAQGKGLAVNFSPVGMQIQVEKKLATNTKILIEVFFPTEIHKYTGEVAWSNEIGDVLFAVGVRILFKKIIYRTE